MNQYQLSRNFWDYSFENTGKIKPNHISIYFFAVEHCNRLGWKKQFGLPTAMVLDAVGIKSYSVYKKTFDELVDMGFFEVIEYSKNQYSSNIIALKENIKALDKALDKAMIKHCTKQSESTVQSIDSIDKHITINIEQETINNPKKFPTMPTASDAGDIPEIKINSCIELLKITKQVTVDFLQVQKLWPVFLAQNVNGTKYYANIEAIHSHFINWIKTQKFESATKLTGTPRQNGQALARQRLREQGNALYDAAAREADNRA